LVVFPDGWKPIEYKWVFKKKISLYGNVEKNKERLVTKGYSQVEGIYFGEMFFPVAKLTSIMFLLFVVVAFYLEIQYIDVMTTFLHGDLKEEIYVT